MKKFTIAAIAMAALLPVAANAENILYNFEEQEGDAMYLEARSYVEYQATGATYPNFYVGYANKNVADAATQTKVFSKANISIECTGPNGYTYTEAGDLDCAYDVTDNHKYFYQGVVSTPGEYTYKVTLTGTYVDETKAPYVKVYNAKITFPSLEPTMNLTGTVVDSEGTDARINYNAEVLNYTGAALNYNVELFEGKTAEGTALQTKNVVADGFVIDGLTEGTEYSYTIKATATSADLAEALVKTQTFTWTQTAPAATFNINLGITADAADFKALSETSGTLPYVITATGDVDKVEFYTVKWSTYNSEDNDVHNVTALTGELTLEGLNKAAITDVWAKVMATSKDGLTTGWMQVGPLKISTVMENSFTYSITAQNPVALSATTGTIDVTINAENAEDVAGYKVWVVTNREGADVELGRTEFSTKGRISYPYTVTVDLSNLNESAETALWAKCIAVMADGTEATLEQYPNETSFPEGGSAWNGLSIDTKNFNTGVESAVIDAEAIVDVYNVAGVRVRAGVKAGEAFENLPAGLYIAGGKKVVVK